FESSKEVGKILPTLPVWWVRSLRRTTQTGLTRSGNGLPELGRFKNRSRGTRPLASGRRAFLVIRTSSEAGAGARAAAAGGRRARPRGPRAARGGPARGRAVA